MENKLIINNTNLNETKERFLEYLDINELTVKSYRNGINCFIQYLNSKGIKNPTRTDFKEFRDTIKQEMSINTVNSYMTGIRAFFNYLEYNNLYINITRDVKHLKISKTPTTQILNIEDCQKIYATLENARERALFSLAISTGLRAQELANAKIENIKQYNGETVLFVKCKKRDDEGEFVKLSDYVLKEIADYIGDRKQGNIFVSTSNNNSGGGITSTSVRNIIKNIFKRNGIEQDWFSCHTLRKSACTIAYNLGADIVQIQQMAHHASIATTRRYINQNTRNNNKVELQLSNAIFGN